MEGYQASELFMGIGLIIAAIVVTRYTRRRTAELPPEEKSLGLPLYVVSLALLVLGFSSLMMFFDALFPHPGEITIHLLLSRATAILGTGFLSIAALMILEWNEIIIFPGFFMALGVFVAFLGVDLGMDFVLWSILIGMDLLILLILPVSLFGYLVTKTRRATSLSIGLGVFVYSFVSVIPFAPLGVQIVLLFLRLSGPALIAMAFLRPNVGISLELVGYGASYAVAGMWFSFIISLAVIEPITLIGLTALALVAMVGFGTASYTYGRWRATGSNATFSLTMFYNMISLSMLIVAVDELIIGTDPAVAYSGIILTLIATMFMNLSAFVAMDLDKFMLLPIMLLLPSVIYLLTNFPAPFADLPLAYPMIGVTAIVQLLLPTIMYAVLSRRMMSAGISGTMRPLSLAIGSLLVTIGTALIIVVDLTNIVVGSILLSAALVMWWGVTGRADRMIGKRQGE